MKRRLKEDIEIGDRVFAPIDEFEGTVIDINGDEVLVDGPFGKEYHNLNDLEKLGGDYEEDEPSDLFKNRFMESKRKKIIRLTESDLIRIVKRVINESENRKFYIIARPSHLEGKGMFIYTGGDGYSMIPTSLEFRRRMHDEMQEQPMSYETEDEAYKDLKKVRKGTKHRPDLRWEIVKF